jgi:hypothetical protein
MNRQVHFRVSDGRLALDDLGSFMGTSGNLWMGQAPTLLAQAFPKNLHLMICGVDPHLFEKEHYVERIS